MTTQIVDEGHEKTVFAGGGSREIIPGKGRPDLTPPEAEHELEVHFEAGANKYEARNWEKGLPLSTFFNSGMRHFRDSFKKGLVNENHEAAAHWNTACYLATLRRIQNGLLPCELDDRPIPHHKKGHTHVDPSHLDS